MSEAERALLRRAVTLIVELERREVMFAQAGAADDDALAIYQTTVNTLRRTLESLGLQRRPRDLGPTLGQILREGSVTYERHHHLAGPMDRGLPPLGWGAGIHRVVPKRYTKLSHAY